MKNTAYKTLITSLDFYVDVGTMPKSWIKKLIKKLKKV